MARKTKNNNLGIAFDIGSWSVGTFIEFADLVGEGKFSSALPYIEQVITDRGELEDGSSLSDIPFTASMKLVKLARQRASDLLQKSPEAKITVDLDQWKMDDFENFVDASAEGDFITLFELLQKVVEVGKPIIEMTLSEYGGMLAAVNAAVRGTFQ